MDLPILIASGAKDGRPFKTEWYQPTLKNGKLPSFVVFRHPKLNTYFYGIIYQTETPPENNFTQTRDVNVFKAHCVCRNESGTTQITNNSNPRIYAYNENYKLMAMAFNFDSNYDVPPSIGGWRPSDLASYYSTPPDSVLTRFPYVGIIDTPEFWENVKDLKDKLAFEIDTSTEGGGDGDYDDNSSDTIGLPDLTTLNANSINNTRFFTCYKLTPEELSNLSKELWSTNFIDIISNSVLKPTDFIVSMNMIPINVPSTPKRMKAGQWLLNGAIGGVVSGQFFRVDCGSIQIKKKWGGALDYLTKIALFLPFIGEVQLSPDDVMGSTISVIYTVDVMTGSCLASVKIVRDNLDAILYQYNGNCSATYPIVSQDYSALMSGVLQLGIHTIADYTKSLPQLKRNGSNQWVIDNTKISRKENLESGATSCLFDISPNVQRVGNMSSTVGFMGIKKPFIILSRPIQSLAENYNTYRGFVSNISMTLGECTGYTEVEEIHLENISATENEISEIENLLKSGVIF